MEWHTARYFHRIIFDCSDTFNLWCYMLCCIINFFKFDSVWMENVWPLCLFRQRKISFFFVRNFIYPNTFWDCSTSISHCKAVHFHLVFLCRVWREMSRRRSTSLSSKYGSCRYRELNRFCFTGIGRSLSNLFKYISTSLRDNWQPFRFIQKFKNSKIPVHPPRKVI